MKIHEILLEYRNISHEIPTKLRKDGYKFLGAGVDQQAWLEPGTGLVLKIFGADDNMIQTPGKFIPSDSQKSFISFADYCMKHPNNPFLPQFFGWETFEFDGRGYLQIRTERLFPMDEILGAALAMMASNIRFYPNRTKEEFLDNAEKDDDPDSYGFYEKTHQLITHIGREGFDQLWDTIHDLARMARAKDYALDLHSGNFMLGSDGHIVISDPFVTG